jgi:hypothetical protein
MCRVSDSILELLVPDIFPTEIGKAVLLVGAAGG